MREDGACGCFREARHLSLETLGATDVICTEKTGTLTRNVMTVTQLWRADQLHDLGGNGRLDPVVVRLLLGDDGCTGPVGPMVRCSDATVTDGQVIGDPTEVALVALAIRAGAEVEALRAPVRLAELPFDASLKLMAVAHRASTGGLALEVKGAPDVLLERCDRWVAADGVQPLDGPTRARIVEVVEQLAGRGLRTLANATRQLPHRTHAHAAGAESDVTELLEELTFEAVVAIVDPPRPGAAAAVATAQRAGIRVVMVTGDHPRTVEAIARELGIVGSAVTGTELNRLDDAELAAQVEQLGVVARVAPEHKVRIVHAL